MTEQYRKVKDQAYQDICPRRCCRRVQPKNIHMLQTY